MAAERVAEVFEAADVLAERARAGRASIEFFRRPSLSLSVYRLEPGEPDRQQPHNEDEIYYVLDGEGIFEAGGERLPVRPGSIIYVDKLEPHRFADYPTGITLLAAFAPARGTNAQ